ncbi:MAG: phosphoribosylformylglycinamidine synthase subunit PurS [bacterium]|nr:phosphoribosylformylglycinamidine synthase subunit PurS [bacterium]
MRAFRVTIMLKPGVLDAPGQAVERGLDALGYRVEQVRVGKVVEMILPEGERAGVDEICARFLANPLIETWTIEEIPAGAAP